jgi:site-specific recombinase XerD
MQIDQARTRYIRWLLADPWSGASLALGRSRRLRRILAAHELDRLIEFLARAAHIDAGRPPDSRSVERRPHESTTLLAVSLMVATGVRVHEAVGIRCQDIDLQGRSLRLLGKGRRERQVFLTNDWITGFTSAYLDARATLGLQHPHQVVSDAESLGGSRDGDN